MQAISPKKIDERAVLVHGWAGVQKKEKPLPLLLVAEARLERTTFGL